VCTARMVAPVLWGERDEKNLRGLEGGGCPVRTSAGTLKKELFLPKANGFLSGGDSSWGAGYGGGVGRRRGQRGEAAAVRAPCCA
jgi:hypothetical protein